MSWRVRQSWKSGVKIISVSPLSELSDRGGGFSCHSCHTSCYISCDSSVTVAGDLTKCENQKPL